MTRDADAGAITKSKAAVFYPFILVELFLDSGTLYVCSLDKNIVWNSNTYLGVGDLGKITPIQETTDAQASGVSVELTGIPTDYTDVVLGEDYHGRKIIIRQGFLDSNFQIAEDPPILFEGIMDQAQITLGKTITVRITAEDDWIRWEEPILSMYTNAEQQYLYPGDLGLEFVSQVVEKEIIWGRT